MTNYDPWAPPDPFNPWDPRNDPSSPDYQRPGGLPAPGGGGIVLAAILYLIMLLSTVALISATIAGPILRLFGKWFDWDDPPPWSWAFSAAFFGFFVYFLVALMQTTWGGREMYNLAANPWTLAAIGHIIAVQSLPILTCGSVIAWRLGKHFEGFAGFRGWLHSVLAAIACYWISTAMIAATARRVADSNESGQGMLEGMLGLAMLSILFAVPGGVLAMIPIGIGTRIANATTKAKIGFWRTYFASVQVLIIWMVGSLALEFAFNTLDPVYFYFKDPAVKAETLKLYTPFNFLVPYAFGFLCLQLAAIGFAGNALAIRMRPVFPGRAGWLRASVLAFFGIAAAVLPAVLLLAAMYVSGQFMDLFQYF